MRRNWRAIGLAAIMVALLMLAACGGAVSTVQTAERQSTAVQSGTEPGDTVVPTDTVAPTDPTEPVDTADPIDTAEPTDAAVSAAAGGGGEQEYEIVTLLPPDAIPAIDEPRFYGLQEADEEYHPQELVIGVEVDGEARAYSVSLLSRHEIVNDTVAGRPISVTW